MNANEPAIESPATWVKDEPAPAQETAAPLPARTQLLRNPNFRWLIAGSLLATLGNQFTVVALPWLMLRLTGDSLALGTVMAAFAIPQVLFLFFGGVLADRLSPKRITLFSYLASAALLAGLALMVLSYAPGAWMINSFALAMGMVGAIGVPAIMTLVTLVLPGELIAPATSLLGSIRQGAVFIGPLLAGLLLGVAAPTASNAPHLLSERLPFVIAFLIDAAGFLFVTWAVAHVKPRPVPANRQPLFSFMLASVRLVTLFWTDKSLRYVVGYWLIVAFCLSGPVRVGLPLFANEQTHLGATALGLLLSANSIGVFLGMLLLGAARERLSSLGKAVLRADVLGASMVALLGLTAFAGFGALGWAIALIVIVGIRAGFVEIGWFSWVQMRIPEDVRGRAMSIFMVLSIVTMASSMTLSGLLARYLAAYQLFICSGVVSAAVALLAMLSSRLRSIRMNGDSASEAQKT